MWIHNISGDLSMLDHTYIYKYRRVCYLHFEERFKCRYNRISNIAIPTLSLRGNKCVICLNIYNFIYICRPTVLSMIITSSL